MSHSDDRRYRIQAALAAFGHGRLADNALALLDTLGYRSDRRIELDDSHPATFLQAFPGDRFRPDRALLDQWRTVDLLCQISDDEIRRHERLHLFASSPGIVDNNSYLFIAVELAGDRYSRTKLAQITREVNRLFPMPAMLLFRHGPAITLAIINRRPHLGQPAKDVLEKVTLIKDVAFASPHRAHLEILADLSLDELSRVHAVASFDDLHAAWRKTLDSSELNKRFFKEIANWYFWAVNEVAFPEAAGPAATRHATGVIRLITRLIFVWFLKEKGLVPDDLFNRHKLDGLLTWDDPQGSAYYKAILQNLFFATLNQEMNTPQKPDNRKFRGRRQTGSDAHFMVHNVYRYQDHFRDPAAALALFAGIPFLNGGLFECLDRRLDGQDLRLDGFSDRADNPLRVPDTLFFGDERAVDLNETYGTKGRRYAVRGLIDTLGRYKFTIAENTPIEEEIALDPELLGKVFENLLAAYNPETGASARKQTGSFYTPREIVDYMVDESLIAYLDTQLRGAAVGAKNLSPLPSPQPSPLPSVHAPDLDARLRHLLAYNEEPHQFDDAEVAALIEAIDGVKILDPACGSGAFPMGILHKLVFVLGKLDPRNVRWKERQIAPIRRAIADAAAIPDSKLRQQVVGDLEQRIAAIEEAFARNELDYGRKLFLIENCIYGVDIQPIAMQIAKLRFFISLVVDQRIDDGAPNRGIIPLPNLETKFVAANTLLGIEKPHKPTLPNLEVRRAIGQKEEELKEVRQNHFSARTPTTKEKYRQRDSELRAGISELLKLEGFPDVASQKMAYWNPYDQNTSADFFEPEWMFGRTDGFDIVIGNPPYVRQEKIKELKPALQKQYSAYTGVADLYVYFYEAGYRLLRQNGVLTYISSNKYFRSGYGAKLRAFLGRNATIRHLIDFGDAPIFTAIAYPSIVVLQKTPPDGNHVQVLTWQPGPPLADFPTVFAANRISLPQRSLGEDGWRLENRDVLRLLDKLRASGKPFGEYVQESFYRGIITGLNEAFIVDRQTRERLILEHPSSAELLGPYLRGRDVKRWQVSFAEQYLIKIESSVNQQHPWSGLADAAAERVFAQCYPAIHLHFTSHREKLIRRYDQGRYFWELRACAYWREFIKPKIVSTDIARRCEFTHDTSGASIDATLFCIPENDLYLLGLLNSRLIEYLYSAISSTIRGDYLRFKKIYLYQIPIHANPREAIKSAIEDRVQQLLQLKGIGEATLAWEREIDELVYGLYDLTAAEVAIIEGQDTFSEPETDVFLPAPAVPSNDAVAPPLYFTGRPPEGSFSEKLKRLHSLASQASPPAIQELVAALADTNDTIRWTAGSSLRQIGGPEVVGVLQAFLAQTEDGRAREAAETLLRSL